MDRVAAMRGDIQQNGVVEDIVDPELFPRFIPTHERKRAPLTEPCDTLRAALVNSQNRGSYTWIPTKVAYNVKTGKSTMLGPIQNLPRTPANKRLYELLERSLTGVMPSLYAQSDTKKKPDDPSNFAARQSPDNPDVMHCKVSIKLQRYRMPPHSSYKGMWHTEGVTERVVSAAVLYVDWPEELEGGALKFRPVSTPNDGYRDYLHKPYRSDVPEPKHYKLSLSIPGKRGSSVAFANTIPHRFETLKNKTDKLLMRSFVNFFLTDPDLPDTNEVPTNADVYLALVGRTNYDIVNEILQWLGNTPTSVEEAKALRSRSKAEMVDKRSKWGSICYGNCGQFEFLPTGGPDAAEQKFFESLYEEDDYDSISSERAAEANVNHKNTANWDEFHITTHRSSSDGGSASLLTAGN